MLTIIIPDNNLPERKYIINTLFSEFLGLKYDLIINSNYQHYSICFDDSEIVINDSFFRLYPENFSYLTISALPKQIRFTKTEFSLEGDIPIIYGHDEIQIVGNKIICGIDLFASSFFMLTRWEEYVNKERDNRGRFLGSSSVAYNNGFLHRPVVNEYVEMLWLMLKYLGYNGMRKTKRFELILTHDIDHLDYPKTYWIILGDLVKRKNLRLAIRHLKHYIKTGDNPYDTFNFIMTISEKLELKSHFYFMSSDSKLQWDGLFYLNSKRFREKIKEIRSRGHIIGFHPGYYTFNDSQRWNYEKNLLENAIKEKIVEGRQHYLRFDCPSTFRIWDNNNMEIDSSLGYAEKEGFRCGTGDIFPVFDFLEGRILSVKERPLIIMDGSLRSYQHEQALKTIRYFISVAQKYKSTITLLFHNSTFYGEDWTGYDYVYMNALNL